MHMQGGPRTSSSFCDVPCSRVSMCVGGTYFLKSVVRRNHMVILWLKGCRTLAGKAQGNRLTHELQALAPSGLHRQEKVQRSLSSHWSNSSPLSCLYRSQMAKLLFMTELCAYQSELLVAVFVREKKTRGPLGFWVQTQCVAVVV